MFMWVYRYSLLHTKRERAKKETKNKNIKLISELPTEVFERNYKVVNCKYSWCGSEYILNIFLQEIPSSKHNTRAAKYKQYETTVGHTRNKGHEKVWNFISRLSPVKILAFSFFKCRPLGFLSAPHVITWNVAVLDLSGYEQVMTLCLTIFLESLNFAQGEKFNLKVLSILKG